MKNGFLNWGFLLGTAFLLLTGCNGSNKDKKDQNKAVHPNILLIMADNQYFSDLGAYGNTALKTPNIDKLAKEGVKFDNAFCQAPSCSPARAAMLTGKDVWTLKEAADLWSTFPADLKTYTSVLEDSGYLVGVWGKAWGPGDYESSGWKENPGGPRYGSFEEFYNALDMGQPWYFWYSSRRPARPFTPDGGEKAGIDISKIEVPPFLPDNEIIRKDIADYYYEIERFDNEVGHLVALLSETGQLKNTIIIVCADNGWQMPRGLANLYDHGSRIPLIVSWPGHFKEGRSIGDYVLLNDLGPTILEMAGLSVPADMTAKSFLPQLESDKEGIIDKNRNSVVMARERHAFVRMDGLGYPERAMRNDDYLYIRNYEPDRWPAGDPPLYGDVDANNMQYPAPAKMYMLKNKDLPEVKPLFDLSFGKRPAEELYDLKKDPYQMTNVAGDKAYEQVRNDLSQQLTKVLKETGDPREGGAPFDFDTVQYFMDEDKTPHPSRESIKELGLKEEYSWIKK